MKLGTTDINKAYIGSTEVSKMFLGTEQVFGPKEVLVLNENVTLSEYAKAQRKVGIYLLQGVRGGLVPPITLSDTWTEALRTGWKTKVSADLNPEVRIHITGVEPGNTSRINCFAGYTASTSTSAGQARLLFSGSTLQVDAGSDKIAITDDVNNHYPYEAYIRGYYNEAISLTSGSGVQLCAIALDNASEEAVSAQRQTLMSQLIATGANLAIGIDGVNGGTRIDTGYYIDLTKSYIKLNGEKTYFATTIIQ